VDTGPSKRVCEVSSGTGPPNQRFAALTPSSTDLLP
jgi:hypothetical protein